MKVIRVFGTLMAVGSGCGEAVVCANTVLSSSVSFLPKSSISLRDQSEMTQPLVTSLVILNADGMRISARYCNRKIFPDLETERRFERELMKKVSINASGQDEDIFELDDHLVVYRAFEDVVIFLTAAHNENEIILVEALRTYEEALGILLRKMIDEEHLLTNLESVMLATDEMLDQEGIIMETDAAELAVRVGPAGSSFSDSIPLGEQTLTQALQQARDQITRSILN